MGSALHIHAISQQPLATKLTPTGEAVSTEHATDRHCKRFILTAFWCGGGGQTQNAVSS